MLLSNKVGALVRTVFSDLNSSTRALRFSPAVMKSEKLKRAW